MRNYCLDEIHTPDSSRYWIQETFEKRISSNGQNLRILIKNFLGFGLKNNCDPYTDEQLTSSTR